MNAEAIAGLIELALGLVVKYGPAGVAAVQDMVARIRTGTLGLDDATIQAEVVRVTAQLDAAFDDIASYRLPGV